MKRLHYEPMPERRSPARGKPLETRSVSSTSDPPVVTLMSSL